MHQQNLAHFKNELLISQVSHETLHTLHAGQTNEVRQHMIHFFGRQFKTGKTQGKHDKKEHQWQTKRPTGHQPRNI